LTNKINQEKKKAIKWMSSKLETKIKWNKISMDETEKDQENN
jgi:hypothetical protein